MLRPGFALIHRFVLAFGTAPKFDARTGPLYETGYNQVFIDPVTGETRGKREWGAA